MVDPVAANLLAEPCTQPDETVIETLSVRKLANYGSPFRSHVWDGVQQPITRWEVRRAIARDDLMPPSTAFLVASGGFGPFCTRADHIRRVAWLVVHGWSDPIQVDVGVPSMGWTPYWIVYDGNHRFAAALYRGDETIEAECSGDIAYIETLRAGMPRVGVPA